MESYTVKNLTFTYPNSERPALCDVTLSVPAGSFYVLCGKSGCGKTTLLRLLKTVLAPAGACIGEILFCGRPLSEATHREQAAGIGFVLQSPDNQLVTDKVWHELAFGLESLGYSTTEIRTRVAEMASFFGIEGWFHKRVTELSGGQKQLLNLASVMVMQPSVLILDEPTGQLDPIAAQEFLNVLKKINRELGTTVLLSEHRLEEAIPLADRVIVLDEGRVMAEGTPREVGGLLQQADHEMAAALPVPMRVFAALDGGADAPLTVREGKSWLETFHHSHPLDSERIPKLAGRPESKTVIELRDVWFRYEKNAPDVIKGLSLKVEKGEIFAIMGGNGAGKTTALSLISGLLAPYRGKVLLEGEPLRRGAAPCRGQLSMLPQSPQLLFVKKTVKLDFLDMLSDSKLSDEEKEARLREVMSLCRLEGLSDRHPYDLSGGEQQRAALAKMLLTRPRILLLDEPTKGMDICFKESFAGILSDLQAAGVTIVLVSHDLEFCARYADRCAMFFDGGIIGADTPRAFFAGKSFYTTAASRMARTLLPEAVLAEDIILAGGRVREREGPETPKDFFKPI